jgi:acetoacetyl-CoA synthetase
MVKPLWTPDAARIANAQITAFADAVGSFSSYAELHAWSCDESPTFWSRLWDFTGVIGDKGDVILENPDAMPGARWFPQARLNFARNLLREKSDRTAIVARLETGQRREFSYAQVFDHAATMAAALKSFDVVAGDRVAAFMPNVPETVFGLLGASSFGAVWTSCSPDFGINGVIDRFGQSTPSVLIACDGYHYGGKVIDTIPIVNQVCQAVPSIRHVILVTIIDSPTAIDVPVPVVHVDDLPPASELEFTALPFDHPLYVMYSSGTTGVPKCIVHGAGGTLLQHLKEHRLHTDITPDDRMFYFTTCGWMMWNWLVTGLASGCTLMLFDGSPTWPRAHSLIDVADEEGLTIFGTSAKYISSLQKLRVKPRETHKLTRLRTILSTGSPLSDEGFEYVYRDFKTDVCLSSISGGTDIVSCFALGNPALPVVAGELQCLGLGMAVDIFDDAGSSLRHAKGELVCTQPFPSMPIGFWNDDDGSRYADAYFDTWDNVWAHGDYGEITDRGSMVIYGRSDAVLNPGGVRIGTAEIYRQVEKVDAVVDAICVGQQVDDDVSVILFVVLREGVTLSRELSQDIRAVIRANTTPRHVPRRIIQVTDVPRTISGKIVELAVRNVIHGEPVKNVDALANPGALEQYRDLPELQQ